MPSKRQVRWSENYWRGWGCAERVLDINPPRLTHEVVHEVERATPIFLTRGERKAWQAGWRDRMVRG